MRIAKRAWWYTNDVLQLDIMSPPGRVVRLRVSSVIPIYGVMHLFCYIPQCRKSYVVAETRDRPCFWCLSNKQITTKLQYAAVICFFFYSQSPVHKHDIQVKIT